MKKLLILSFCTFLISCSQYQDKTMVCKGSISIWTSSGMNLVDSQIIGMRIEIDKISLNGNGYQGVDELKVCKIGSIEFSKKDVIYFDTDGCSMEGKDTNSRKYGTYNYITKELNFTQQFNIGLFNQGTYDCKEGK